MAAVDRNDRQNGLDKSRSKRRRSDDEEDGERSKQIRSGEKRLDKSPSSRHRLASPPPPAAASAGGKQPEKILTLDEIKKIVEQRKKEVMKTMPVSVSIPAVVDEKKQRQMELAAKISAVMAGKPDIFGAVKPGAMNLGILAGTTQSSLLNRPPGNVILDNEGRTIDLVTGKAVTLEQRGPTLKANIRAKKREDFRQVQERVASEAKAQLVTERTGAAAAAAADAGESSGFYDPRVAVKQPARARRQGFHFYERGTFVKQGQMLRAKAQLEKLQSDIASAAKKTGITSAAALARIAPKKGDSLDAGFVPEMEWWDGSFAGLGNLANDDSQPIEPDVKIENRLEKLITALVEHPVQLAPQIDKDKPVALPMMLTKKERKKLRRQTRREKLKEEQEKQRIGLQPAPEPKVKMGNLMRVLGSEAVQDPTKVEAQVRAQVAKRRKQHETANALRKLTETERRAKKVRRLKEDTTEEVHVSLYRLRQLNHPAKKFKVETNAAQLYMTGVVIITKEIVLVIVEGGPKQQRKFKRLMLTRIKWSDDQPVEEDGNAAGKMPTGCELVWEGSQKKRHFGPLKTKACAGEQAARELLRKHGVEEMWDLAYGAAILESAD